MNIDDYETGSKINLNMKIDPNLKSDTKLSMGENEITYEELSKMYPILNQEPIRCIVYWDDIMQMTSLGLIDIVNALFKLDVKIDIKDFIERSNEYSNGLAYVFKQFENKVSKEDIIKIRDKYYWKILLISLKTTMFNSLQRTSSFFTKLGFWFPVNFENCETLKIGMKQLMFNNKPTDSLAFYYGNKVTFHEAFKMGGYNSIITPNVKSSYNYIIKNDIMRISIIGPENHNGIDDETYKIFYKYKKLPRPNYCSVNLYKEDICLPS